MFLTLTRKTGPVLVNLDAVQSISPEEEGGTVWQLACSPYGIVVVEPFDQVLEMLRWAGRMASPVPMASEESTDGQCFNCGSQGYLP